MNCEYIANYYNVPACIGRRVIACGEPGIIAEDRGNYTGVNLDKDKPGVIGNYHPTHEIEYLGIGKIRKMTRSQERYRHYISSEYPGTFAEYLGIQKKRKYG